MVSQESFGHQPPEHRETEPLPFINIAKLRSDAAEGESPTFSPTDTTPTMVQDQTKRRVLKKNSSVGIISPKNSTTEPLVPIMR